MIKRLKNLFSYRKLIWQLSLKTLKSKYSGSMLGLWWAIVTPLILAISINIIFTNVFKVEIRNFTLFVLAGIIPWLFFSNTLSEATNSFIINSSLLRQSTFPREIVPVATIFANFLNFIIGFLVLLPLFIIFRIEVILVLPLLLLVLLLHLIFLLGLGIIFSSLNVFSRDVSHFLSIGLMIWFWITPIFYSLDMIKFPYRWVCLLNPMTYYVIFYRDILFEAKIPSLLTVLISLLIAIVFFGGGYLFFLKKESKLLKRI